MWLANIVQDKWLVYLIALLHLYSYVLFSLTVLWEYLNLFFKIWLFLFIAFLCMGFLTSNIANQIIKFHVWSHTNAYIHTLFSIQSWQLVWLLPWNLVPPILNFNYYLIIAEFYFTCTLSDYTQLSIWRFVLGELVSGSAWWHKRWL